MWRVTPLTENRRLKAVAVPVSRLLKQRVKLQLLLVRHLLSAKNGRMRVRAGHAVSNDTRQDVLAAHTCTRDGKTMAERPNDQTLTWTWPLTSGDVISCAAASNTASTDSSWVELIFALSPGRDEGGRASVSVDSKMKMPR